jgi:hypothetical protein
LLLLGCLLTSGEAGARQFSYVDAGVEAGLGPFHPEMGQGTGIAAADYDGDGLVDVFAAQQAGSPNLLYRNLGNGGFEEIGAQVGLASLASSRTAIWIDYDGDHDLDLLVANDDLDAPSSFTLYRQNTPTMFEDVTVEAGVFKAPVIVAPTHHWGGLCAADLNHDSYLDFFAAQWPGPGHLFLNTGNGGFVDVSIESGVGLYTIFMNQPAMLDFDGDGWQDIYINVDFGANMLLLNQKNMQFNDVAGLANAANNMNDMGITFGDYDNDGDFDLYLSNIYMEPPPVNPLGPRYNVLYRNDSTPFQLSFTDVSESLGVNNGGFGWGVSFVDTLNDGWVDIASTNGWRSGDPDASRYFLNPKDGTSPFTEIGTTVGFDDGYWGSALVAFDYERDGDLDLMQACMDGPLRLLKAEGQDEGNASNGYFSVVPRMDGPNHFAIGATVRAKAGGLNMMRAITAGISYMGQEPAEAHFGLGIEPVVQLVRITWPDGSESILTDVAPNQRLMVQHGGFGDLNADGVVALDDYVIWQGCQGDPGQVNSIASCLPADFDGDLDVDLSEFAVIQQRMTATE